MVRHVRLAGLAVALGSPACSGTTPLPATNTTSAEAGAAPCTASLAGVGSSFLSCPGTYAAAVDPGFACSSALQGAMASAGTGMGLGMVSYSWGTHGQVCVYADTANGSLVGAIAFDDLPDYCDQTSNSVQAGNVPQGWDTGSTMPVCPQSVSQSSTSSASASSTQ